ncbi:ABC transporter permease [Xanthobacter tagetidis]|jgi:peptide/nickel transport system permease protein|uniref:ABC transporter permease n=1 Tax=Xanthobacter tagetidis TaxID=60216 RepID=A0A3L7AFE2_9HYPH|nr:ABC transporter permease [Xanthobacter tagetidis]MBB6305907.1 peptide/nickel transport system permease protein [Xanthobacter tagetidis]RLP78428.1 ABC transporter permease [Xanthobacter tagetidis]
MTAARATLASWWDGDLLYRFRRSPVAIVSLLVAVLLFAVALGADAIAPYDAFDPAAANVVDARLPPGSAGMYGETYLLGTDPQGRDMLSAMIYGLRTSLMVGLASVVLAALVGVLLGLVAGYFGGVLDAVIMRIADVQLSFPAILIALLIDGVTRTALPREVHDALAVPILVFAIAASFWVQYARTVRGLVLVERNREYVLAARVIGVSTPRILFTHILPNVLGPVLVIATINLALAILTEATLSFLGVGLPSTQPSLGSLVRIGNEFVFSGDWWISAAPGALLVLLSLSVNIFGDFLRDALNPKLAS